MTDLETRSRIAAMGLAAALSLGACSQATQLPAGASVQELQSAQEKDRNDQVVSNMRTLQMAIEQYAVDHQGAYPSTEALLAELMAGDPNGLGYYLPGNRLSDNPWAPAGQPGNQANVIDTSGMRPVLTPAGQAPTAIGTMLGAGRAVGTGVYDARTFGALLYELDAKTQTYTLYAVGKRGEQAMVVGAVTNGLD